MSSSVGYEALQALGQMRRASVHVGLLERAIDFRRVAFVAVTLVLLSGCTPALIKMEEEDLVRLNTQPEISAAYYPPVAFHAPTSGIAALAGGLGGLYFGQILGEILSQRAGDEMIKKYSLQDPVLRVKERFLSTLSADFGLTNIRPGQRLLTDDNVEALKREFGEAVLIDFKTIKWDLGYYMLDWSHYRIAFSARARMVRLEDSKIIWQGVCDIVGKDRKTSPTLDELESNNGALLKVKLNEAADRCVEELLTQFSGRENAEKRKE